MTRYLAFLQVVGVLKGQPRLSASGRQAIHESLAVLRKELGGDEELDRFFSYLRDVNPAGAFSRYAVARALVSYVAGYRRWLASDDEEEAKPRKKKSRKAGSRLIAIASAV